jgi:hypothetical protein
MNAKPLFLLWLRGGLELAGSFILSSFSRQVTLPANGGVHEVRGSARSVRDARFQSPFAQERLEKLP